MSIRNLMVKTTLAQEAAAEAVHKKPLRSDAEGEGRNLRRLALIQVEFGLIPIRT
ncbi:hypothetical protein SynMEDNS5_02472 [Synechococcus sp. MEDNS5]|nr:hypothetical protein SynMEDNS5_02472 [Synechococcus sp. MEDNS5]